MEISNAVEHKGSFLGLKPMTWIHFFLPSSALISFMIDHPLPRKKTKTKNSSCFSSLQFFQVNSMRSYHVMLLFKNFNWLFHCLQVKSNPPNITKKDVSDLCFCYSSYLCYDVYLQLVFLWTTYTLRHRLYVLILYKFP